MATWSNGGRDMTCFKRVLRRREVKCQGIRPNGITFSAYEVFFGNAFKIPRYNTVEYLEYWCSLTHSFIHST
jgi:hypothetical protein